jgi:uncharacterized protein YyaL (SSP411 family)
MFGARTAALVRASLGDALRYATSLARRDTQIGTESIDAGVRWLISTHEVTERRGSSKGWSFLDGWRPAFPETTGYVIGTLLARSAQTGDASLVEHAHQMGDWEIEIQGTDGGIQEGVIGHTPKRSIVFDTGMVMHGWLDLHEWSGDVRYLEAAGRGGEFLARNQEADGSWRGEVTYSRIPHTYNARVAWALLRLARAAADDRFADVARRKLDWVLARQRSNGWFDDCVFKAGMLPSTHSIAYTLRGLSESGLILDEPRYMDAAVRGSEPLLRVLDRRGWLPATYHPDWRPGARYMCLTGTAQVGGVWLRLHQATGDPRLLHAGMTAIEQAAAHQVRTGPAPVRGALAGSFPVFGRYAPLQYPNWATKFLVDSLMLRQHVLAGEPLTDRVPGSVPRSLPAG